MVLAKVINILRRVDSRIVTILSRTQERKGVINSPSKVIYTDGDERSILRSINEYDRAVLTQLVARNPGSINSILLKIYSVMKSRLRSGAKKMLKVARRVKARVKHVG